MVSYTLSAETAQPYTTVPKPAKNKTGNSTKDNVKYF